MAYFILIWLFTGKIEGEISLQKGDPASSLLLVKKAWESELMSRHWVSDAFSLGLEPDLFEITMTHELYKPMTFKIQVKNEKTIKVRMIPDRISCRSMES